MALSIADRRLGAILLEQGYVTDTDLQKALVRHAEVGGRLADILIDSGQVGEKRIARAIEEALGIPLVNLLVVTPEAAALAAIRAETARQMQAFPFALEGQTLRVALVDPLSSVAIEALEDDSGLNIEPYQALRDQVQWSIATYYPELGLTPVLPEGASGSPEGGSKLGQRLV
ncbi:MAG: type II/IV secretion system protein, partial [Bacillota bacterium]